MLSKQLPLKVEICKYIYFYAYRKMTYLIPLNIEDVILVSY